MKSDKTINGNQFSHEIGIKEIRKLKSIREEKKSPLLGLGMFGMVGWSIVIPTLLGLALGIWIDKKYPASISWTLSLMIIGLFCGCLLAGYWVANENKGMHEHVDNEDEHE